MSSGQQGRMLRKIKSWQNWTKTYGSERKRNERAAKQKAWHEEFLEEMEEKQVPFTPPDFEEPCEDCGAAPGEFCKPHCGTGYTAEDFRTDVRREREKENEL